MPHKVVVKNPRIKDGKFWRNPFRVIRRIWKNFSGKPELKTLESAFNQVETRYRLIKKQQETILDRLVDDSTDTDEQLSLTTKKLGDEVKADFFKIALKFAGHQKEQNSSEMSKSSAPEKLWH